MGIVMSTPVQPESCAAVRQIANWKFIRPLGKGGMAEVFEVENARLGTHAALKLFSCAKDKDGEVRARFLAEAALLARLNHPRLVRVFDYGIDPATDRPYFVMDLVLDPSGSPKTLADKEFVGADESHVAMWYDDLREALAFIHARGIVHRDVKLQNVLVGPDGHAVLSDFGVAKIFDTSLREDVGLSPEETIHAAKGRRTVMGSLGYLAPELEMGVAASPASDYYALGVLVFYLLTGTWCEPRTDIAAALETYDPVWQEILPKLLHANPSARKCPSWREQEKSFQEKDAARAEAENDRSQNALAAAHRHKKIAIATAVLFAVAAAILLAISLPVSKSQSLPEPVSLGTLVRIPDDANNDSTPSREEYKAAVPVARWFVCEIVNDMNCGKKTKDEAVREIKQLVEDIKNETLDEIKDEFVTTLDADALQRLLEIAADNLVQRTGK